MKTLYESILDVDNNIDDLDKSILIGGHYEFDGVNCRGDVRDISDVMYYLDQLWMNIEKDYKKIKEFKELYLRNWENGSKFICLILNAPINILDNIHKFKSYISKYIYPMACNLTVKKEKDYFIIGFEEFECGIDEYAWVYFRFKKINL